ncbi:hypothetical protein VNO77_17864 [Canavalia gladiata]|uniref:Uncharacterized protein n=1 Tax=Canavalia gladiata TaxID=3824 RepID=A0AAN9LPQ8_CANGL
MKILSETAWLDFGTNYVLILVILLFMIASGYEGIWFIYNFIEKLLFRGALACECLYPSSSDYPPRLFP